MQAGVHGYILKRGIDGHFLRDALELVGRYGAVVSDPRLYVQFRSEQPGRVSYQKFAEVNSSLSSREREVLPMVVEGWTDEEISERLVIAVSTARDHIRSLRRKLGAKNRTHLASIALRHGLA